MSSTSRIRSAGIAVATAQDCLERMRIALQTADDALRSVHRTRVLDAAIGRVAASLDLCAQLCAAMPDSGPLFTEAEIAHQLVAAEVAAQRRPEPCNA